MVKKIIHFPNATTVFHFDDNISSLGKLVDKNKAFIITETNVYPVISRKLKGWKVLTFPAGEAHKHTDTVNELIGKLIVAGADRQSIIIGIGGGVATDVAGFVAAIYMRGIRVAFVPTSILAMVDASIGGKNGVDVGIYKNMVGTFKQPEFLLYDYSLLKALPKEHWINGFAEIIKHGAIRDAALFKQLEQHKLTDYKKDKALLNKLIMRNALLKAQVVAEDPFEKGDRKLLNFGHTLGHAIENPYGLLHGHAVAIGMTVAAYLSKAVLDFKDAEKLVKLIRQYHLPAFLNFDAQLALKNMLADKKRIGNIINYVLLEKIGHAVYKPLTLKEIEPVVEALSVGK